MHNIPCSGLTIVYLTMFLSSFCIKTSKEVHKPSFDHNSDNYRYFHSVQVLEILPGLKLPLSLLHPEPGQREPSELWCGAPGAYYKLAAGSLILSAHWVPETQHHSFLANCLYSVFFQKPSVRQGLGMGEWGTWNRECCLISATAVGCRNSTGPWTSEKIRGWLQNRPESEGPEAGPLIPRFPSVLTEINA